MSIDLEKIESFRALEQKESKAALAEYAATFDVKLNKQKSFDNMLLDLIESVPSEKPVKPDDFRSGAPIELIEPPHGEHVTPYGDDPTDEGDTHVSQPLMPYMDVRDLPILKPDTYIDVGDFSVFKAPESEPEKPAELLATQTGEIFKLNLVESSVSDSTATEEKDALPEGFKPTILLMGAGSGRKGYYTCPWWIYDWIKQNPDWKEDPDRCPHYSVRDTLRSLIYFIRRDGSVMVRETRNSSFDELK